MDASETQSHALPLAAKTVQRHCCPSCLGSAFQVVYAQPYSSDGIQAYLDRQYDGNATDAADDAEYTQAKCAQCGLVYQVHVPNDALLAQVYGPWSRGTALEVEHRNYSLDEYRYLSQQVQFVIEHFGRAPAQLEVLDFGFGWAHWARMAMGFGCNVSGVELSEERKDYARRFGIQVLEQEELPQGRFHFINTEQVFEHLVQPREVLQQLVRSLAPGGVIKISVPDCVSALKKIQHGARFETLGADDQMQIAPLEHINSFDASSLVNLGRECGLEPMRPSFAKLYNSASGLLRPKSLARTLGRPFYRHIYPRSTFIYFTAADSAARA
jgi:SAM-dependent methyltransferase